MKLECLREKLLIALQKADRVTSKNPTLAVLSSVVIGAEDNQIVVKATNLEVGVEITLGAKVSTGGVCAINASILASFLANIPHEKNVTLELDEGVLKAFCGSQRALVKTVPYEDFPVIPSSLESSLELPIEDFTKGLLSVWYSASVSSIKPELSSVYVYSEGGELVFVATDSFRLAEKKIKVKKEIPDLELLIPYKNIMDLVKVFDGESGLVNISFNKNQISCSLDNVYITSRLVDGTFVDYRKIIPKEYSTEVILLRDDLLQALRMMKVFSDKFNQITIGINGPKGICEFMSKNSDVGESTYNTPAKVKGETVSLNFNHKYISDGVTILNTDSVEMLFNGSGKPLLIKGHGDQSFTYLVMPNR